MEKYYLVYKTFHLGLPGEEVIELEATDYIGANKEAREKMELRKKVDENAKDFRLIKKTVLKYYCD